MKSTIILNAGHSIADPGAVYHDTTEAMEARKIRDYLVPLLKQNFEVIIVPDHLNLLESIDFVNTKFTNLNDGLAFSIHLNANGGNGAETYYYGGSNDSKKIAKTIIDKYCQITGYKNRGAKDDRSTRHGRLGWIRDTNTWACLIEVCFIDNMDELQFLHNNLDVVAQGIYEGICSLYEITPVSPKQTIKNKIINLLNKL